MTKKKRSVLMAVLTCVLCIALAAGGTYALFSDKVTLTNHLEAGKLDITLIRTNLVTKSLNKDTGFLKDTESPADVDFTDPTGKNIFDLTSEDLIVPKCMYTAEMKISNLGDVAFGYWVEIVYKNTTTTALANQLNVKIVSANGTLEKRLDSASGFIGSEASPIGVVAKTGYAYFTVSVEFLNLDNDVNNLAQDQTVDFDLIVHAVQATTPTP